MQFTTEQTLTEQQRRLVQRTFGRIASGHADFARLFFDKLFEQSPALQACFEDTLNDQYRKFMRMLALTVNALHDPVTMHDLSRVMISHFDRYGVRIEEYDTLKASLEWTLETYLGKIATPYLLDTWRVVINMLFDER